MPCRHFPGTLTIFTPSHKGSNVVTVKPREWKIGNEFKITSSFLKFNKSLIWRILVSRFLWVNSMPFGSPSLPLLNKIVAVSSKLTSAKLNSLIQLAGMKSAVKKRWHF